MPRQRQSTRHARRVTWCLAISSALAVGVGLVLAVAGSTSHATAASLGGAGLVGLIVVALHARNNARRARDYECLRKGAEQY